MEKLGKKSTRSEFMELLGVKQVKPENCDWRSLIARRAANLSDRFNSFTPPTLADQRWLARGKERLSLKKLENTPLIRSGSFDLTTRGVFSCDRQHYDSSRTPATFVPADGPIRFWGYTRDGVWLVGTISNHEEADGLPAIIDIRPISLEALLHEDFFWSDFPETILFALGRQINVWHRKARMKLREIKKADEMITFEDSVYFELRKA